MNIIKPPKINIPGKGGFWKQIGMMVFGTTISLLLTISVAALMEKKPACQGPPPLSNDGDE